jgi:hypothetical protein
MKIKNLVLTLVIALTSFVSFGCGGEEEARQVAMQLRAAIVEDEKLIDKTIETQTKFYEKQRETIENSRSNSIVYQLDGERRQRSAEAATVMSLNPEQEARLSNLTNYLIETNDKEYELWKKLYGDDQEAREDLKSKIAKLQRQKKVLTQVKDNLNQLALSTNRKKRAKMLLQFSQQTYAALKASR